MKKRASTASTGKGEPQKRRKVEFEDSVAEKNEDGDEGSLLCINIGIKAARDRRQVAVYARRDTTDVKVVEEVLKRQVYHKKHIDFGVADGETWLDLGCNIGTFALFARACGARRVICYEPESSNLAMMTKNLEADIAAGAVVVHGAAVGTENGEADLYVCNGDANKYRHTIYKKRGRASVKVPLVRFLDVLHAYPDATCVKMDIEGAEIAILEDLALDDLRASGMQKLVFEYTFDHSRSIPRFMAIINKLRQYFSTVYFSRVKPDMETYNFFPPCDVVYCKI